MSSGNEGTFTFEQKKKKPVIKLDLRHYPYKNILMVTRLVLIFTLWNIINILENKTLKIKIHIMQSDKFSTNKLKFVNCTIKVKSWQRCIKKALLHQNQLSKTSCSAIDIIFKQTKRKLLNHV